MEMLSKLDTKFIKRYGKRFAALNSKINIIPVEEDNTYLAPIISLSDGGATVNMNPGAQAFELAPAARIAFEYKKVAPKEIIYRMKLDETEAARAAEDDNYFNYIFDTVVEKSIAGYMQAFGDADEIRFGKQFCIPYRNNGTVFSLTDDGVELRLYGHFASNVEINNATRS